jgi:hypothetical protein
LNYKAFFSCWFLYSFRPPYIAPAAINKDIPPSIGTHGGGQQSGVLPEGGGGGNATQSVVKPTAKSNINKNLVFIV